MQIKESDFRPLPTGRLLRRERLRLLLMPVDVARAVGCHAQAITTLERLNRVILPGWLETLRGLGMQIQDPIWPHDMRPFIGLDWAEQIKTLTGLGHSAFRWSRKLGVAEEAVRNVLRSRDPVPHNWLLKLAELGVEVPAPVGQTLKSIASPTKVQASRIPLEQEVPKRSATALPLSSAQSLRAAPAAPAQSEPRRERPSFYFHWTEDGGLHFSISTPLLDQLPAVFKELFVLLSQSDGLKAGQSSDARIRTA